MTPEQVIELVHEIDDLERKSADISAQIQARHQRLAAAMAGASSLPPSSNPENGSLALFRRLRPPIEGRQRVSPLKNVAMRHIQDNPRADYQSLVMALYKKNTPSAVKNARTMIFHMKSAGLVEGEPGSWRTKSLPDYESEPTTETDAA